MNFLNLKPGISYDAQAIINQIKEKNTNTSDQRARWILFEMERSGLISRVGKKTYCAQPRIYSYNEQSEIFRLIKDELSLSFPSVNFVMMETRQLNEWVNLLIAKNTLFIEVESGIEEIVFSHLQERLGKDKMILLCPNEEMISRYSTNDLIIVKKLFSRAPLNRKTHIMTLEQMSVDMLVDKDFKSILGGATLEVVKGIHESYDINADITLNYSLRRRCNKDLLSVWGNKR